MKKEEIYLEILNNLYDGVYFVDTENRIFFWNKAAEDITGYKSAEVVGCRCQNDLLSHISSDGHPLCVMGCPLHATMTDGLQRKDSVFLRRKDGQRIPINITIIPIVEDEKITGAIEIFSPNSNAVYEDNLIERLSDLAMNDQLTGLANRRKLKSFLEYRLNEFIRLERKFCVIFLDIDNFSDFNDTCGHETGDEVLKTVADAVKNSTRKVDIFGRWGGEEFIGIYEIKKNEEALLIAEKLRCLIAASVTVHDGKSHSITASLGVTVARSDDTIESIIRRADELMYKSKQNNKNCVSADF